MAKQAKKSIDSKVESTEKNLLSKELLDQLNALNINEKTVKEKSNNSIYFEKYTTKSERDKIRRMLCTSKDYIENEKKEWTQIGLIPDFLTHIKRNELVKAENVLKEISDYCIERFKAKDSFNNPKDYFSANRKEAERIVITSFINCVKAFREN